MKPQVEAWAHGVGFLSKISQRHPQLAYAVLVMVLQLEWQYLQRTVPGVGTLMGPIEHRCELPGNYPVFTVVMVIYTFVRRISIITLPPDFF